MKNLEFYGDLKKDIETLEEPIVLDKKTFWSEAITMSCICFITVVLTCKVVDFPLIGVLLLGYFDFIPVSFFVWKAKTMETLLYKKQQKSKENINELKLALQKENVYTTTKRLEKAEILEIDVPEKEEEKSNVVPATYYAFLDNQKELQYLRQLKDMVGRQPLELLEMNDMIEFDEAISEKQKVR